jgi:hypothetical protein
VRPEAGLDVRDGNACGEARQRSTEGTRRVALHDKQVRRRRKARKERFGDVANMAMRVFLSGAIEPFGAECSEAELHWIEVRVLAGEDQRWSYSSPGEGLGNRCYFYGFGPGPDDEPDVYAVQPSP